MVIMTAPGTDSAIDELSKRVDFGFEQTNERLGRVEDDVRELRADMNKGFDKVDARFEKFEDKVDARFEKVDARFGRVDDEFKSVRAEMKAGFDGMNRLMIRFFAGTLGTVIAGVLVTVVTVLLRS